MPATNNAIQERRTTSQTMIKELVGIRDHVLVLYSDLAARQPFLDADAVSELLQEFCQTLIDYTADTHFRLYRYIDEGRERRQQIVEVADRVYSGILDTTDEFLNFNDKYDFKEAGKQVSLEGLGEDLSRIGERLADRIELEDQIIAALSRDERAA